MTRTFLEFGHQIYVEIVFVAFLLLAEGADHVIVKSQSIGDGEIAHGPLVVLRNVDGFAGVLTCRRIREALARDQQTNICFICRSVIHTAASVISSDWHVQFQTQNSVFSSFIM